MSKIEIIQAWKDARYRRRLSLEEQADLPEHPAGSIELDDDEMEQAFGGDNYWSSCVPNCPDSLCWPQCGSIVMACEPLLV